MIFASQGQKKIKPFRVLVVDDSRKVRNYAKQAFCDFDTVVLAEGPDEARQALTTSKAKFGDKPFHLLSCDINMPDDHPTGLELMKWFHNLCDDVPIICHSDDVHNAQKVKGIAVFVGKIYVKSGRLNMDEIRLRAKALDILEGVVSYENVIQRVGYATRQNLDDLGLEPDVAGVVMELSRNIISNTYQPLKLASLARVELVTEFQFIEVLKYYNHLFFS